MSKPLPKKKLTGLFLFLFVFCHVIAQSGSIIPTGSDQKNFLKAYQLVFNLSDNDYRGNSAKADVQLFPKYGEFSVYWALSGTDKGSFIIPDTIPAQYSHLDLKNYSAYNWQSTGHRSIQYKKQPKKIAVFQSKIQVDQHSINWEAQYFKSLFETFIDKSIYYFTDEDGLAQGISDSTEILIIPAFNVHQKGDKHYIDSVFTIAPQVKTKIEAFLNRGGKIYTEGNAAYFLQKAGITALGNIDFANTLPAGPNGIQVSAAASANPISFAAGGAKNLIYGSSVPMVSSTDIEVLVNAQSDSRPVVYTLSGSSAQGGKIVCNLGLPTAGGVSEFESGSRQLQWTLNTLLYFFSHPIDVSRSVFNILPSSVVAGDNSVSYDRVDTFDIKIIVRNLSSDAINQIQIEENFRNYFSFVDIKTAGVTHSYVNGKLTLSGISLPAFSEKQIVYRAITPKPDDDVHQSVDKIIDYDTYVAASIGKISYSGSEGSQSFTKKRNYADIMFSARIFADADVNWKNFLNLEYQPFKVFMIMENKERTQAENTVYTQYIPKDVPFYWTDHSINIPILKTPAGQFVDILRGSNDQNNPEYDLDSDGKPDVWLDTASIFPKGYTLVEEEVYWANPWNHLRTGDKKIVFEDIDHDGVTAEDTNGDGIVDIEEPGDKIRVWKVTWNIGTVKGYEYYDPYCSYEVWVDPPDMVKMAAGVGKVYGTLTEDVPGMFYPYTPNIASADKSKDSWKHWMDKDGSNNVIWKDYIFQHMQNYMGYTFIDMAGTGYELKPYDKHVGRTPQPHEEFIAVLSMGGEEIDMYHPTPSQSLYSKVDYKTIFNEDRVMPIRTTYSYYAPLPNPLQFEYLASNFSIADTLGNKIDFLPAKGKARLKFDLDASTEYTYYWIRNFGTDVDYNDPSEKIDGIEPLGDGVFGYMIYEIPKGMGGYKITLPKKADGTYDTDNIVNVEGKPFSKWLDNPNTGNQVEIWEDQFTYQVYIPQVLIPAALDDDNHDGVDDWIDDRGDRFKSNTGYLHDPFMAGNGEDYPTSPSTPFEDVGYGTVTSGWNIGADNEKGDDTFETLGKMHYTINALYEGKGREGSVDISKGGTLVVEEIFGGSPWVIFSHVLAGYAKGVDYKITSEVSPSTVKYGTDTVVIKHTIEDLNEPHEFNANFDPYHVSFGHGDASATSLAGGKDPCSLIQPAISTSTIIDPSVDHKTIRLIPSAKPGNPDLTGYPRNVSGTFLEVKVEVMNGTNDNWYNTKVTPVLKGLGNTKVEMAYVAYPRPLVPAHIDGDKIVPGDQPGTFTTGWRFNQPEGEVLVKMGNNLNFMQPTRRGYYIFLFTIDESLKNGIYTIDFTIDGKRVDYKGAEHGRVNFSIPSVQFSIIDKDANGKPKAFQKMMLDKGTLDKLVVRGTEYFEGLKTVKWTTNDVNFSDFASINKTVPASYDKGIETIDLSGINRLPNADSTKLYLLEKAVVNSYRAAENIDLTNSEVITYSYSAGKDSVQGNKISVSPYGPKILIRQTLYSVNGVKVENGINLTSDDDKLYIVSKLEAINVGSDISENTVVSIHPGAFYNVLTDSLPSNVTYSNGLIHASMGMLIPGETKAAFVYYGFNQSISTQDEFLTVIKLSDIKYEGTTMNSKFSYSDTSKVLFEIYDFQLENIASQKLTADKEYLVEATAINRGVPAKDVWLRIYPVVGEGISEFPIAEMKIEDFKSGQKVSLPVNYTAPNSEQVQMYAKIDDGNKIPEIIEKNNAKIVQLAAPTNINDAKKEFDWKVYPNPFDSQVKFEYLLQSNAEKVTISVFTQKGSEVITFSNCPTSEGVHSIDWIPANLADGNYIYRFTVENKDGKKIEIPGILIKTDN